MLPLSPWLLSMERMMRSDIDVVTTAAMLETIVLIGSSMPVGLIVNHKNTFAKLTMQIVA